MMREHTHACPLCEGRMCGECGGDHLPVECADGETRHCAACRLDCCVVCYHAGLDGAA
jgi:hypothetical protein